MKILMLICLLGVGLLTACGGGPTAPAESEIGHSAPPPTPTPPSPCRPYPKCVS